MRLTDHVELLRGVGPQRAAQLKKLGILTLEDLLSHYPRGYLDLSDPQPIVKAPFFQTCAIRARVEHKYNGIRLASGRTLFKVLAADDTGGIELRFFNAKFTVEQLKVGEEYLFYGKAEGTLTSAVMTAPLVYPVGRYPAFQPIYSLTSGLSNKALSNLIQQALGLGVVPEERIPPQIRERYCLEGIETAIHAIHRPSCLEQAKEARRRFQFEELFTLAVGIGLLHSRTHHKQSVPLFPHSLEPFYKALPFQLTQGQLNAIQELTLDMQKPEPANRLVQGDVGSGKTMVAAAGAYFAFLSQAQTAFMAPTELLATQHYQGLSKLLGGLGMRVALLTGSTPAAQKRAIRQGLAEGSIDLCIGTHALLSQGVEFQNLALVITDEQHRFGVAQRAALQAKGRCPHALVMSATPIPRTLALMIYGELDISVIHELPPNRHPVLTYKISSGKRERAFGFIKKHLDEGFQAYIVCPLVEEGEEPSPMRAASQYAQELSARHFAGYRVGLLHGKMKASLKEETMSKFQSGEIQLLISTTVVEVGVDVPNAVIILIENAERFGLSQLHQLRGRVGRGQAQSYCLLLSDTRNPDTLERLQMMCSTNDGFAIAEYDLKTRGPGNFLGQEQHGLPKFRIADLTTDVALLTQAQEDAGQLLAQDHTLEFPEHSALRRACEKMMETVGQRPN